MFDTAGWVILEARPRVQAVFLLRFAVGVALSTVPEPNASRVGLSALGWTLAVVAIYLLNGVSDLEGDRFSGSRRPLASGRLSPRTAVGVSIACIALSCAASLTVGARFFVLVTVLLVLGVTYSFGAHASKLSGSLALVVAGAAAFLTYAAGSEAAGSPMAPQLVVFAVVIATWLAVLGHIKDLSDVDGDRRSGRRTLPVV